jgi:ElaB/YqjD/DUF883 family membrane-anchored ribosome-binding protein
MAFEQCSPYLAPWGIGESAMPASTNGQPALDEVSESAHSKFDQAMGEFRGRAQNVAHETMQALRSNAKPYVDTAGERLDQAERYLVEKVQKQPLTAIAAALGAGLILGLLLGGGRSR